MPCLEENPKTVQVVQVHDAEQLQSVQQEEPQPARELTQTDVLNNRLLKSFLNRMNTGDIANKFNNQPESTQATSDFDDDDD